MGTKDFPPRYHPQFAIQRTFDANTSKIFNGITRQTLLNVQAAAPGGKPGTARKRFPPSRSLWMRLSAQDNPIFAIEYHIEY